MINQYPSILSTLLHTISLQLALAHRMAKMQDSYAHTDHEGNQRMRDDLILSYRNVRRHIEINESTGSTFGSRASYNAMQGLVDEPVIPTGL